MVRLDKISCVFSIALLAACSEPTCEPIAACDIRTDRCHRAALKVAACLRDSPIDSQVQVEVVDYDVFVEERVRDATAYEPSMDEIDLRAGLARFGLSVPLDLEDDARRDIGWVGAFYDSQTDRVTVLDRGTNGAAEARAQTILLVHEMTHALQGAGGVFDTIYEPIVTYDALLAALSVIEGEATLVEDHAVIEALGFDFDDSQYGRALRAYRKFSQQLLVEAEDLFVGVRSGIPYAYGASFMYEAYKSGGASAVARALDQPIGSTRELLGRTRVDQKVRPALPVHAGAVLVGSYHLGGFFFDAFLRRIARDAPDVSSQVVDDVFSVQRTADGKLHAAWRLRFDADADLSAVTTVLSAADSPYQFGSEASDDLWIVREPDDSTSGTPPVFAEAPEIDSGFSAPSTSARSIMCGHPRVY